MPHSPLKIDIGIAGWVVRLACDDAAFAALLHAQYAAWPAASSPLATLTLRADAAYRSSEALEMGDDGPEVAPLAGGYRLAWRGLELRCDAHFTRCEARVRPEPLAVENVLRLLYGALAPRHGGLLMHASAVVAGGEAYVLCGKSGAGKSTSYGLAPPAARIGDECVALRPGNNGWLACGTPFAEGALHPPRQAPLGGLFLLEKAAQHALVALPAAGVVQRLLGCVLFHDNAPAVQRQIFARVIALAERYPTGGLAFRRDAGYLEVLHDASIAHAAR